MRALGPVLVHRKPHLSVRSRLPTRTSKSCSCRSTRSATRPALADGPVHIPTTCPRPVSAGAGRAHAHARLHWRVVRTCTCLSPLSWDAQDVSHPKESHHVARCAHSRAQSRRAPCMSTQAESTLAVRTARVPKLSPLHPSAPLPHSGDGARGDQGGRRVWPQNPAGGARIPAQVWDAARRRRGRAAGDRRLGASQGGRQRGSGGWHSGD